MAVDEDSKEKSGWVDAFSFSVGCNQSWYVFLLGLGELLFNLFISMI